MGEISKHGTNPGSLVAVTVVGPVSVPLGQSHSLTDFQGTVADPGANTALILQKSNDNFVGNVVEIGRLEMPVAGTFEDSPVGDWKVPGGAAVQWRVRAVQSVAGALGATIHGQTLKSDGTPGPDVLD